MSSMVIAAHVDKLARRFLPFVIFVVCDFASVLISASCWQGFGGNDDLEG